MGRVYVIIALASGIALLAGVTDAGQRRAAFESQAELLAEAYGCPEEGCLLTGTNP